MYEIVEGIHKALKIETTWAFVLVVSVGAALVGGFFAWIIDTGYRNSPEYKADHPIKQGGVTQEQRAATPTPLPRQAAANSPSPMPTPPHHEQPSKTKQVTQKSKGDNSPNVNQEQHNSGGVNIQQQGQQNNAASAGTITQGPGSIAQVGGTGNQATVNNYAPLDRHINPTTASALTAIAQSVPNKDKYPVGFITVESGEAEAFADEIAMVFYKQGIGAGRAAGGRYWSPQTPRGVVVCVKAKDDPAYALAEKIANAMNGTGVPAVGIMLNDNMDTGKVLIVIGEKTDGRPIGGATSYLVVR